MNSFALSNKDVADALKVSSSAMQAANNTFEETVALITAGTEITQDPSRVGNGLRTISMRIRGLNEETGEFDETLGNVQNDISELTHGLVSIMDDPNTYKSTYEILKRISEIWDQLTDKEQAGLLEKLFGKTRAQIGAAILANFESAEKAIVKMEESAGSADKEMGIIMDSLDYKLNKLKETGVGIWQNLVDRGSIGKIVDGLTTILNVVDKLTGSLGVLGTVLTVGGVAAAIAFFTSPGAMLTMTTMFYGLINALPTIAAIGSVVGIIAAFKELNPTVSEATARVEKHTKSLETLEEQQVKNNERIEELKKLKESNDFTLDDEIELSQLEAKNKLLETQIENEERLLELAKERSRETSRKRAIELLDEGNDPGIYGIRDVIDNYNHAREMLARDDLTEYQKKAYSKQVATYGNQLRSQFDDITTIISQLDPVEDAELIAKLNSLVKDVSIALEIEYDPNGKTKKSLAQFKKDISNLKKDTKDAIQKMFDLGIDSLTDKELGKVKDFVKECGYSLDELIEYFTELYDLSETSVDKSTSRSIGNLTSFRDELLKTSAALKEYTDLMEGGEKGDSIATMQEIYKGALEDLKSGKVDTNRLRAAAQLFFSPEQLAEMNFDMEEVGRRLQTAMLEGLFDPKGESKNTAGQRMIKYIQDNEDAFKGIAKVTEDGSGKINFFYSSLKELADAFGISEAAMAAFLDEWDAYGTNIMRSTEENQQLISDYEDMVKEIGNAKVAVQQLAAQMHNEGSDMLEISSLLKDLQNAGVIKLSDKELNDTLTEVFKSLGELESTDPETTAYLDGTPAINSARQLRATLEAILTPPITTTVNVSAGNTTGVTAPTPVSRPAGSRQGASRASGGVTGKSGPTLVNELGPELISDQGKAYIANGGKPGFTNLSKDAIVFNAEETSQIFKYGFTDINYPAYSGGTRKDLIGKLVGGKSFPARATITGWTCPFCGRSNPSTVSKCRGCGKDPRSYKPTTTTTSTPKISANVSKTTTTPTQSSKAITNTPTTSTTTSTAASRWTCNYCGATNSYNAVKCWYCSTTRGASKPTTSSTTSSSSIKLSADITKDWYCPVCGYLNTNNRKTCAGCGYNLESAINTKSVKGSTNITANQQGNYTPLFDFSDESGSAGGGSSGGGGYDAQSRSNPQKFDWISVLLKRIQRAVSDLEKVASSGLKKLSTRLTAAKDEAAKLSEEISVAQKGYDRYLQEANSVGLDESIAAKVRNGTIDINEYEDEDLIKKIQEFQEWYEKALECASAVEDLNQQIGELYKNNFDLVQADYGNQLALIEHEMNMINKDIEMAQAKGMFDSASYYEKLITQETQSVSKLRSELSDLQKYFNESMSSGKIQENSEAWYEMKQEILGVEEAIADANIKLQEYQNTIRSINWGYFDYAQEQFSNLANEANFLIDIMSNDKLFNDNGQLNATGFATLGMRAINYDTYMAQADEYYKELQKIQQELASNPYDKTLIDRRNALLQLQQQSIQSAEAEKNAVKSLVQEGIQLELNALKELIASYEESLDSAKDLYDYQKKISEKSADVASIQKQLAAYQGDTSEETRAKVQKLTKDLEKAQTDLAEAEWQQSISDQKKLLDDVYSEYEELLNSRLDNVDSLMREMIDAANENASTIRNEIANVAAAVGYSTTDELNTAMNGRYANYSRAFEDIASVNTVLNNIYNNVNAMARASGAIKAYASGGLIDYTGIAAVHGRPGNPELVLSPSDTERFLEAAQILRNVQLQDVLSRKIDTSMIGIEGFGNSIGSIDFHVEIDHVQDYDDFVRQLQSDPKFEKLVNSMTLDRMVGGSKLAKNGIRF